MNETPTKITIATAIRNEYSSMLERGPTAALYDIIWDICDAHSDDDPDDLFDQVCDELFANPYYIN